MKPKIGKANCCLAIGKPTVQYVRGIIIVGKKDDALRYALGATSGIEAKEFKLSIG
jgi:hypothetical protein